MKVLCSACEAAEARVLCCADEAALCARCDRDVHAANRLAGKHHRLPLQPPAAVSAPDCDICQESHAYFFCVEDRALLCRSCDVAVHTANAFASTHRRFLLTGVQVGLQPDAQEPEPHPPNAASAAAPAPLPTPPPPPPAKKAHGSPAPLYSDDDIDWTAGGLGVGITGNMPDWSLVDEQFGAAVSRPAEPMVTRTPSKRSPRRPLAAAFAVQGGLAGGMADWPLDEFFGFSEFNAGLGFTENGTSKADSGKLGSTDGSPTGRSSSGSAKDMFGQVPEFHQWSVPELPSPPTDSGLHWQGGPRHGATTTDTAAVFVPDISSPENPFRCFAAGAGQPPTAAAKRRRRC
ncbi:B-box zinc finger protein 22 [Dichanthelium oligosanthes]|uniref:B-box zinc finger protein 22 n=1 Tax=Dichanthelium oligosanthes TaxID=888268 RepID=A0A1E5VKB9_9POAL|nr:B-box zinc finger protein 22 [Dichanthelium oligosanthes]